jgi:hypothetical protein
MMLTRAEFNEVMSRDREIEGVWWVRGGLKKVKVSRVQVEESMRLVGVEVEDGAKRGMPESDGV